MKDVRINVGFWDHWKTISLKAALGLEGVESLQRLWCFAAMNKPDGVLSGLSVKALEMTCRWNGEQGKLVEALKELRFIDDVGGHYELHDWKEHNGFVANFARRSEQARQAISKRWDTDRNTDRITDRNTPSPTPTPTPKPSPTPQSVPPSEFSRFWAAYPKKRSKGQAEIAFSKVNPDEQLLVAMLAKIEQAKKSEVWTKDNGRFIPHPATWLRAKGWEDELPQEPREEDSWQMR